MTRKPCTCEFCGPYGESSNGVCIMDFIDQDDLGIELGPVVDDGEPF